MPVASYDFEDSPEALAISERLVALVRAEIARVGGWIPFSRFMGLALYAPGLGYYSAGAKKIGRHPGDGSDFVTAPELTPLFGRALARSVADVLATGVESVLELGGGSGRLASDLLLELERLGCLPTSYALLEVAADLRERQIATLRAAAPHLLDRVRWIDAPPAAIDSVVIANEVLDALPVELVRWTGTDWEVRGIADSEHGLTYVDRAVPSGLSSLMAESIAVPAALPEGYLTEVAPAMRALVTTLTERLSERATSLFIDYGFPRSEYYHPQRVTGTLMAHRRHRATTDLLALPGLQDITAHVDFHCGRRGRGGRRRGRGGLHQPGEFSDRLRHRAPALGRRRRRVGLGTASRSATGIAVGGGDGRTLQGHRDRTKRAFARGFRRPRPPLRAVMKLIYQGYRSSIGVIAAGAHTPFTPRRCSDTPRESFC